MVGGRSLGDRIFTVSNVIIMLICDALDGVSVLVFCRQLIEYRRRSCARTHIFMAKGIHICELGDGFVGPGDA